MLNLNPQERSQLSSDGSLCLDRAGNETLVGLTLRQSVFVLQYQAIFNDRPSPARQQAYLRLRQRHADAHAVGAAAHRQLLVNVELLLDQALADSFPASDPVAIAVTRIAGSGLAL